MIDEWGTDPAGWALYAEPLNEPLFRAVLDAAAVRAGSTLLDIGCGSGLALRMARDRGAVVTGLDASAPLLAVAAERVPGAQLVHAGMDVLPFEDATFDAVIGVNSFQFAASPRRALASAARVLAPGGRLVASLFAPPELSESTAVHRALSALAPPVHAPYLLSGEGRLDDAISGAGLTVQDHGEVVCYWAYDDVSAAVRGLLASAGGALAAEHAGRDAAAQAIRTAIAPFTRPDGTISMRNTFRWTLGERR